VQFVDAMVRDGWKGQDAKLSMIVGCGLVELDMERGGGWLYGERNVCFRSVRVVVWDWVMGVGYDGGLDAWRWSV